MSTTETDLFGGVKFEDTSEIEVPDNLVDQVIGQEKAVEIVRNAAKQSRNVLMIGKPGTGKSMLAKAMAEMMPREDLKDIVITRNEEDENEPKVDVVEAGRGKEIVEGIRQEVNKREQMRTVLMWIGIIGIVAYSFLVRRFLLGVIAAGVIFLAFRYLQNDMEADLPNLLVDNSDSETAPFEDATGAHTGALLGDVRHDPFQSGGMGTPAHSRVESGKIHKANQGVLFIDEINTLDIRDQQSLMTAIQEGEYPITGQNERSSGAMVQTEEVPCDFVLVAAGNKDAMENMHPALRSRIKGRGYEVHFNETVDDNPETRADFVRFVAQEVEREGNIPHFKPRAVEEVIKEARRRADKKDSLTLQLRDLGGLVRVAGDIAKKEGYDLVEREHVLQAKNQAKAIEEQMGDKMIERKEEYSVSRNKGSMVGRVNGLSVLGGKSGMVQPISARVTPGKGEIKATGKLQEIAEESVENVSAIIKATSDVDMSEKDVHVQFIQTYEGVDGDSASVTIATAILSSLWDIPIKQNVSMTGSLDIRGPVLPIGGATYKVEASDKYNIDKVIVPEMNKDDIVLDEEEIDVEIVPVKNIKEVLEIALEDCPEKDEVLSKLDEVVV